MKVNERVASAGSVFTALLASACCIGPLAFVSLGITGLGFATGFAPYRPLFIGLTVIFLAIGFYFSYRKAGSEEGEECCEPEQVERRRKINRLLLWSATILATFLIALEYFLPFIY